MVTSQHEDARTIALAKAKILAAGRYARDRARRDRQLQRWRLNLVERPDSVISCAEVGQKVCLDPDALANPAHDGATNFTVRKIVGQGADAMHALQAPDGSISKWHRASELRPATVSPHAAALAAQKKIEEQPDLPASTEGSRAADQLAYRDASQMPDDGDEQEPSNAAGQLLSAAKRIAADEKCSLRDAVTRAAQRQPARVADYRLSMDSGVRAGGNPAPPETLSLSVSDRRVINAAHDAKRLAAMARLIASAQRLQKSQPGLRWSDAMSLASAQDPASAALYLGR